MELKPFTRQTALAMGPKARRTDVAYPNQLSFGKKTPDPLASPNTAQKPESAPTPTKPAKPKRSLLRRLLLPSLIALTTGGPVGYITYKANQPLAPQEAVDSEMRTTDRTAVRIRSAAADATDMAEIVSDLLSYTDLEYSVNRRQEGFDYYRRARFLAADCLDKLKSQSELETLFDKQEKSFLTKTKALSPEEVPLSEVATRQIEWQKDLLKYWDAEAEKAFKSVEMDLKFTEAAVLSQMSPPLTPEQQAVQMVQNAQTVLIKAQGIHKQSGEIFAHGQKLEENIRYQLDKFQAAYPEYAAQVAKYGALRPFIFGLDRYSNNASMFNRDLQATVRKLNVAQTKMMEAQRFIERYQEDALTQDALKPKKKELDAVAKELKNLVREVETQSSQLYRTQQILEWKIDVNQRGVYDAASSRVRSVFER